MVFDLSLDLEGMLELIGCGEPFKEYNSITIRPVLREIKRDTKKKEDLFPFKIKNSYPHDRDHLNTIVKGVCSDFEYLKCYEMVRLPIPTKGDVSIISEPISNALYHNSSKELIIESYHTKPDKMVLRISTPNGFAWDYKTKIEEYLKNPEAKENIHKMGFYTFHNMKPIASYDNDGRDFLILFKE